MSNAEPELVRKPLPGIPNHYATEDGYVVLPSGLRAAPWIVFEPGTFEGSLKGPIARVANIAEARKAVIGHRAGRPTP
ncbi:hypothetical protein [Microbispora sp. NPDC049125]|uniref:hypothetical protein n=1 Tax=Microbispora sp. NPDC049125 TaxID=3154929 RepID=UPI0034679A77